MYDINDERPSTGKIVLYLVIFFVSLTVFFLSSHFSIGAKASVAMTDASLPLIMMKTEEGLTYNRLEGYVSETDEALMERCVTILPESLDLEIVIDTYGQMIEGISYQIRERESRMLIEETTVDSYDMADGQVRAVLNIKNLVTAKKEYDLKITLKTEKHNRIQYYSTLMRNSGYKTDDKLGFVLKFNACTLDKSRLSEITRYMETKSSADNSNYGKVNINSTRAMAGWGDLEPMLESNIVPSLHMIDSEVAIVTLDYTVGIKNSDDSYDTMMVHEFYRIRQTPSNYYLLNYDRQTTQIFDGDDALISSGKINLGIAPDQNVVMEEDVRHNYIYFVNAGSMWCFDKTKNSFTRVFAFESDDSDNVRERFTAHRIKPLSVYEDGSGYFLVYGYMNRGMHEGEVGVSLYKYNYEDNTVAEQLYIPTTLSYGMIMNCIDEIAYVNESDSLYIKLDDVLYLVDLRSKEIMTEAAGLTAGTYCISDDHKIIAYHINGGINGADGIRVFNIANGTDHYINAGEGMKVKALGFIADDFIYGEAMQDNIVKDELGNEVFAMHKINVCDSDYKIIREYDGNGAYVVEADVDEFRVNFKRVVRDEDGEFVSTSIDQLINREENVKVEASKAESIVTDARKRETVIKLAGTYDKGISGITRDVERIEFTKDSKLSLKAPISGADRYYVTGYGTYVSAYKSLEAAIAAAAEQYGNVYDSSHSLIWKRFKPASATVRISVSAGADSYAAAKNTISEAAAGDECYMISIQGVNVENMLCFVGLDCPVMGKMLDGYAVITEYTSKTITYVDCRDGKSYTVSYTEADRVFSQEGNIFETFYRL